MGPSSFDQSCCVFLLFLAVGGKRTGWLKRTRSPISGRVGSDWVGSLFPHINQVLLSGCPNHYGLQLAVGLRAFNQFFGPGPNDPYCAKVLSWVWYVYALTHESCQDCFRGIENPGYYFALIQTLWCPNTIGVSHIKCHFKICLTKY